MRIRTTVDLDRELLERAREALAAPTYREAITRALEEVVSRADFHRLLSSIEGSDSTWSLEELLSYRRVKRGNAP
jgi:Arc/MetJ family transcription regulator